MKRVRDFLRREAAGNAAFLATVLASFATLYFSGAGRLPAATQAALIGLGLAFTTLGLWGFEAVEWSAARGGRGAAWAYLLTQVMVGGLVFYLSRGIGFSSLLFFPLASQAMYILPRRAIVPAFALIVAGFITPLAILSDWRMALANSLTMTAGLTFVAVFTGLAMRERQARTEVERLAAELSRANHQLRAYAAQVEELATAKERNRLAREIHDSLGHYLTVINVQLEAAQALLSAPGPGGAAGEDAASRALEALRKAQRLTQDGLADVRRSVAALRAGPIGQRPLPEVLAQLAEENQAAGIVTRFEVLGRPRPLRPQVELTLFRAAQEGLTNLRKHSRASRADVTLDYEAEGGVRLVVRDNGIGAAVNSGPEGMGEAAEGRGGWESSAAGGGPGGAGGDTDDAAGEAGAVAAPAEEMSPAGAFGLLGLRERVQLLNGQVRTHSAPGQGFVLEVRV